MLGTIIAAMVTAFIIGGLARFTLPGPDPMPAWLTIAIGLLGSMIGWGIVIGVQGRHKADASWAAIASFVAAVGLVMLYRVLVQKRPLWGKEAYRFPKRGVGVDAYRQRLKRVGIDPDQIGVHGFGAVQNDPIPHVQPPLRRREAGDDPTENPAHYLGLLEELHDAGVLDDDEFAAARTRLLESLRS
jgi:uncharacterized membrane protein YeaQ/YmgE (transglycosylase-associated protein family)